jgi:tRNA(fMet)-specific endonuclease VapC
MEVICIDTSVLIDYYRKKDKINTFWYELSQKYRFSISAIVQYEILRGDKNKDKFWHEIFDM